MSNPQLAQQRILDAQEATQRVAKKRHEEAAENLRAFERFYNNLALLSGGTIALSVTFLGFLKSQSQPVHLKLLFTSWFCLFLCLVGATFYTYFNTAYVGYARSAEYARKLKEQKVTLAEEVPNVNILDVHTRTEQQDYIEQLQAQAAKLQKDVEWNSSREKLYGFVYRACGVTANVTFVAGIALLLLFATVNLSVPRNEKEIRATTVETKSLQQKSR